jgi:hypothetical protein
VDTFVPRDSSGIRNVPSSHSTWNFVQICPHFISQGLIIPIQSYTKGLRLSLTVC